MAFTFPAMVAEDPGSNSVVKNVSFQVYAVSDTSFTTPLAITDTFNNPLAGNILNSGTKGVFPQFQQATNSTVVITDATHVYAWTINCVQQDSAISSFINTPGSATATALNATYVPRASSQIGVDTDGVPYFSNALDFASAVPVLTDTDGVPYINA